MMSDLRKLQQDLGYIFKDVSLLIRAVTHRSHGRPNNERMEFVGDGILDYVVALYLYNNYPDLAEGELSKVRASLVNQAALVDLALDLNLGDYLLLGDGEMKSGGRKRPSILADCLEAVFAAVSFDGSFEESKDLIERLYKKKFDNPEMLNFKDNKSLLQEYLQARKMNLPLYNVVSLTGPEHDMMFSIECSVPELGIAATAMGKGKKQASSFAAEKVLQIIAERDKNGK